MLPKQKLTKMKLLYEIILINTYKCICAYLVTEEQ